MLDIISVIHSSFNTDRRIWEPLAPFPGETSNVTFGLEVSGVVYFIDESDKVLRYNTFSNKWSHIPAINCDDKIQKLFNSKNTLYAATSENNLYKFDPE